MTRAEWSRTPSGRASIHRTNSTPAAKARRAAYGRSAKGKAYASAYKKNAGYRARQASYRKSWDQTLEGKYAGYKGNAATRRVHWELSLAQFADWWGKPCVYCGAEIRTIGLDRVDNSPVIGYRLSNICSCCSACNSMKGKLSFDDFISHVRRIAKFGWSVK